MAEIQARTQPSDKGPGRGGGDFTQILDVFQRLKTGGPSGCLGESSIFKRLTLR